MDPEDFVKLLEAEGFKIDKTTTMCPICGKNPAQDCGFGKRDPYEGDFDCVNPEEPEDTCDNCKFVACDECKRKK